jgi:glucose/arabinose dehydrogenase
VRRRNLTKKSLTSLFVLVSVLSSPVPAEGADGEIYPEKIVGELRQAVSFTFDGSGRIWFVEKAVGDVRLFDPATGTIRRYFAVPDVFAEAEQGLVGIALAPGFPDPPFVYLYATRLVDGSLRDELLRIRDRRGRGTRMEILWDTPASTAHGHSGGRLLFGPDGMLYVAVGDGFEPDLAQDRGSDRGKILRLTPDGERAPGDPIRGSRAFAYGVRNSFGLAFDPATGTLWETENGPACNDELNRVDPGANLGWGPSGDCAKVDDPLSTNGDGPEPVHPQLTYTPAIAPTGLAFCDGCGLGDASEGALFFGTYNTGEIHQVTLDGERLNVVKDDVVAQAPDLALSFEVGPDHAIYFSSYIAIFRLQLRGTQPRSSSPTPSSRSAAPPGVAPKEGSPSLEEGTGGALAGGLAIAVGSIVVIVVCAGVIVRRRRRGAPSP